MRILLKCLEKHEPILYVLKKCSMVICKTRHITDVRKNNSLATKYAPIVIFKIHDFKKTLSSNNIGTGLKQYF